MTGPADVLRGLPFLAFVLFFGYEWLALTFPALGLPSLSFATYGQLAGISVHPLAAISTGVLGGVALTLLILHLTGQLGWWQP